MAFDFPSSPSAGHTYTPAAGMPTYMWNGVSWDVLPGQVSPGTLVEISRRVITSAVAVVDITGIDGSYDEYELHFYGVTFATAGGDLAFRISQDGGATFKAGATDYQGGAVYTPYDGSATTPTGWSTTYARMSGVVQTITAGWQSSGEIKLFRPSSTTHRKVMFVKSYYLGNQQAGWDGWSSYTADTNAYNAVRLWNTAGNITGGTFVLYGRSKTPVVAVVAPGSKVLIQSQTVGAAVAMVDFTTGIDATYDDYELRFFNVKPSADAALVLRISADNGATWKAGASDYGYAFGIMPAVGAMSMTQAPTAAFMQICSAQQSSAGSMPIAGVVRFSLPAQTSWRSSFESEVTNQNASLSLAKYTGVGCYFLATDVINGLRVLLNAAGNLTQGTFNLYGIKK